MRRDPDNTPFDLEADEHHDVTQEFWGTTRGWISREHEAIDARRRDDTTGSLRAIRNGFAAFRPNVRTDSTGAIERTREHGVVRNEPVETDGREATLGELATGWFGDEDDDWSIPTTTSQESVLGTHDDHDELVPLSPDPSSIRPSLAGVDPLLLRIGAVITALVLLVPLALSLRPSDAGAIETEPVVSAPAGALPEVGAAPESPPSEPSAEEAPEVAPSGAASIDPASDTADSEPSTQVGATDPASEVVTEDDSATTGSDVSSSAAPAESVESAPTVTDPSIDVATVEEEAERQVPECPQTYEAGTGDSWYRIADAAGVTPSALLGENRATVDTVILPGDDICLPAGATKPSQPTTTVATTTPSQPTPTTAPPTTAPPTTQAPSTTTPATSSEVQQIIRDVWPDELEEKALDIAFRESRHNATGYNGWCCYGVFQIYWTVHRSWLDDYGINRAIDLYDARKNTEAAYAIYRRAGGWGPWGG